MNLVIVFLVVALAIRPAYAPIPLETWHVHVVNNMGNQMMLMVHCKSRDNDLGERNLSPGAEFQWKFKMNFFEKTLFWCYWRPEKGNRHANFDVFWKDDDLFYKCNYKNCYWIAKDDGIYLKNIPEEYDEFRHKWEPGSMITY